MVWNICSIVCLVCFGCNLVRFLICVESEFCGGCVNLCGYKKDGCDYN